MYSSLHKPQILQKENVNSLRLSNIFHSIQAAHKGNWKRKKEISEPIENVKTHKLRSLKIKTCKKKEAYPLNQNAQIPYPILKGFHVDILPSHVKD